MARFRWIDALFNGSRTGWYAAVPKLKAADTPLARLRIALGKTHEEMARAAGLGGAQPRILWMYIENGRNKMTSAASRQQLARALGVPEADALAFQAGEIPIETFLPRVRVPEPAPVAAAAGPERTVEVDPRYPNLAEAIRRRRAIAEEAIAELTSLAMQRASDAEVGEWSEELAEVEAMIRRRQRTPASPAASPRTPARMDVGGKVDTSWRRKK